MVDYTIVIKGFAAYLEKEFLPKLGGGKSWATAVAFNLIAARADKTYSNLIKTEPVASLLKALEVISADGKQIDIDGLYNAALPQAEKEPLVLQTAIYGKLTFTKDDIVALYQAIKEYADAR